MPVSFNFTRVFFTRAVALSGAPGWLRSWSEVFLDVLHLSRKILCREGEFKMRKKKSFHLHKSLRKNCLKQNKKKNPTAVNLLFSFGRGI